MRWSVPRELLWAIIGALTISVIALWPSNYPYSQAPKVYPQHQAENGIGGGSPSEHGPPPQINPSSQEQREHSGENATEVSILGIKPGEWLLSIVTLMLWGATVGLVRGADKTAERQLRAYISISTGQGWRQGQTRGLRFEFRPVIKNVGQTPAYHVTISCGIRFATQANLLRFDYSAVHLSPPEPIGLTLGKDQDRFTQVIFDRRLSKSELRQFRRNTHVLLVFGTVRYRDAFDRDRYANFSYVINWWNKRTTPVWHSTVRHNDSD